MEEKTTRELIEAYLTLKREQIELREGEADANNKLNRLRHDFNSKTERNTEEIDSYIKAKAELEARPGKLKAVTSDYKTAEKHLAKHLKQAESVTATYTDEEGQVHTFTVNTINEIAHTIR
jgi:chromosome segregation ATPase